MTQVLSSDQVLDCDESVVFDAAARWLQSESSTRKCYAPEVQKLDKITHKADEPWSLVCASRFHAFMSFPSVCCVSLLLRFVFVTFQ